VSHSIRVHASARRRVLTALGVGLAVVGATAGCAAGQIAQTAQQVAAVDGAEGHVGPIALRTVKLQYPQGGRYREGQSARLNLVMANQSDQDDTLVAVRTDAAGNVTFSPGSSLSDGASGSPSASATGSPSPSGGGTTSIPVGANRSVVAFADGPVITLVGLKQDLLAAETIPVTFSFEKAGDITLSVPVAVSLSEVPQPTPIDVSPTRER
jgi:hypothetical protein